MSKRLQSTCAIRIVYRIYENENGLLLQPRDFYTNNPKFDDYDTIDDACRALDDRYPDLGGGSGFVILSITSTREVGE